MLAAGEQNRVGLEVIAVVCGSLIADPLGLGFRALVMFAGVVELAIAATMQVGVALGAGVGAKHAAPGGVLNFLAAFPAVEKHDELSAVSHQLGRKQTRSLLKADG